MKDVLFVGWVNYGKLPVDGETTKNQYIIAELEKYCKVHVLDFFQKSKHPWVYLQAIWTFVMYPKATIVFSTSASNVYKYFSLMYRYGIKRDIIHWVVGGNFATHVKLHTYGKNCVEVFNSLRLNLVQCHGMIDELKEAGVNNGKFVSNFKPIKYYPDLEACHKIRASYGKMRFVFVSRIMLEKGCGYILQAAKLLNDQGYMDKYTIDFYGKVDPGYKIEFEKKIDSLENVNYHGLLNLKSNAGYDDLATYHAMLFPSFWAGEGFAGVFIDAFIAGLPVLASDWAHNAESIIDGKTGVIYPTHNVEALRKVICDCINGKIQLDAMSKNAREEAPKYQADNVMTESYIRSIGLID